MVKNSLVEFYEEPNNLLPFSHPLYKKTFHYMDLRQLIHLAERMVNHIADTPIRRVIVSECGATLFANICEKICKEQELEVEWHPLKLPRELDKNTFYSALDFLKNMTFLPTGTNLKNNGHNYTNRETIDLKEKRKKFDPQPFNLHTSIENLLENAPAYKQTPFQREIYKTTSACFMRQFFAKPFYYFDEYIDSGKTLNNFLNMVLCFSEMVPCKVIAYMTKTKKTKRYPFISLSLFDQDTEEACYNYGIYPFENRLDLLGYFYVINNKSYQKIHVKDFISHSSLTPRLEKQFIAHFVNLLCTALKQENILLKIRSFSSLKSVAEFISLQNVFHFALYLFERFQKDEKAEIFLWSLFDMYGPIWSPLPDRYHESFLEAFQKGQPLFYKMDLFQKLQGFYAEYRTAILSMIAETLEKRRLTFLRKLEEYFKNERRPKLFC